MINKKFQGFALLFIIVGFLVFVWLRGGLDKVYLDSDIGRDLSEISKLWIGQEVIWLGPRYSVGLHASPFYYYLFYPAVYLSGGNAYSLIIFNVMLAASAILFMGYWLLKKIGLKGLLPLLFIGLSPWWQNIVIHPGNGFTYAIFLLIFITCLWIELPFLVSSFFLGVAASMHPTAIFGLPFFIYEWKRKKASKVALLKSVVVFILPFAPLLIFEIITKGYWIREWLANQRTGFELIFNTNNLDIIFSETGMGGLIGMIVFAVLFLINKERERIWVILTIIPLLFFALTPDFPEHYFLGTQIFLLFSFAISLVQKNIGRVILTILSVYLILNTFIFQPFPSPSIRPISKIDSAVNLAAKDGNLTKNDKIAVLALRNQVEKVPQADDYRFFLRVKGYNVMEVAYYRDANKLILFVENPDIDYSNWRSWETEQFGSKREINRLEVNGIVIVIYSK